MPGCDDYICHMTTTFARCALEELDEDELMTLRTQIGHEVLRRRDRSETCEACKTLFVARRNAKYCSGRCRTAAYRKRLGASR